MKNNLLQYWERFADRIDSREMRERMLISISVWAAVYLLWDFVVYQPLSENRNEIKSRFDSVSSELTKLGAQEKVFVKALSNNPNVSRKREILSLETQLEKVDVDLQKLAVGLIAAERLPEVLHEVLLSINSLELTGMQTRPTKKLPLQTMQVNSSTNGDVEGVEAEIVGIFKHSVEIAIEGDYFSVVEYLQRMEDLEWKVYWDFLDYKVDDWPKASVILEVFTLSTEEGLMGVPG